MTHMGLENLTMPEMRARRAATSRRALWVAALVLGLIGRSAPAFGRWLATPAVQLVLEQGEQQEQ